MSITDPKRTKRAGNTVFFVFSMHATDGGPAVIPVASHCGSHWFESRIAHWLPHIDLAIEEVAKEDIDSLREIRTLSLVAGWP
jgi:hypothetical protein